MLVTVYRAAFTEDGVIHSDRQCEYVRAIAFALLGEEESRAAAATLNQMVVDNGYHLNTGFLSTPFLCGVLAQYGYVDTAYRLLLQPEAPGWLYEVNKGANTMWETWTGIDAEGKPHESLNHYSYGAICGWLFGGVCGIHFADGQLTIAPIPHKALGTPKRFMIRLQAESKAAGGMKEIRSPTNSPFPPTSQHTFTFRTEEHECYLLARTGSKGRFIAQPMFPLPEECEFPAKSMK